MLVDPETNARTVAYEYNYWKPQLEDPLICAVISEGSRVLPRATHDALVELGASVDRTIGSWMGTPIIAEGQIVGAISAVADEPDRFTESHLVFLQAAAAQLAMALENARLLALVSSGKTEWERTVDAIGQAFCVVDANGNIRRANRAFSDLVAIPVTDVAGRPWRSALPSHWDEPVARTLAFAGTAHQQELKTGSRMFTVSALPLGEPAGTVVLVFEDQTERRRLQEQLIQSEKLSAIGQLIAGIAHDLNNPLASVVGFADYLVEEGRAPPELRKPLEAIRQEAERAANIVRNLLSFARKQEGERRPQSINVILEATLFLLKNQLMASKVEADLRIDPELPAVHIDANQVQQVFVNLINNAAQAIASSGREGTLVVHARKWLDGVAVTVEDDGPGIPHDVAARIFEPFFTTKAEGEGTGLGLSICQGIIKEHGGRITYAPNPRRGATFRVELPGGAGAMVPEEDAPVEVGSLRILIVDDEPHILHYMSVTLEAWGHDVETVADGSRALERAVADQFDVIVTDLRMPGLGGREIYEALIQDHPQVAERIVFATGDTVRGDTLQFLESAGQPFLQKPFSLAELKSALARGAVRR